MQTVERTHLKLGRFCFECFEEDEDGREEAVEWVVTLVWANVSVSLSPPLSNVSISATLWLMVLPTNFDARSVE